MVEQILLYTVYQAALKNCSYLEVCFLHGYRNDCTQLGELKGLWANAFNWVREWTGVRKSIPCPIQEMWECEALAYATYHEFIEERKVKGQGIPEDSLYIGVDIGWKKTQAAFLTNIDAKQKQDETSGGGELPADIMVHTAEIEYAGRDISLLNADCTFPQYPELLNILLKGSSDLKRGSSRSFSGNSAVTTAVQEAAARIRHIMTGCLMLLQPKSKRRISRYRRTFTIICRNSVCSSISIHTIFCCCS